MVTFQLGLWNMVIDHIRKDDKMRGELGMKIIIKISLVFMLFIIALVIFDIGLERECTRIDCEEAHWELEGYLLGKEK